MTLYTLMVPQNKWNYLTWLAKQFCGERNPLPPPNMNVSHATGRLFSEQFQSTLHAFHQNQFSKFSRNFTDESFYKHNCVSAFLFSPIRATCLAHCIFFSPFSYAFSTHMRHLPTGIRSEGCVVERFRRCANVIECTYTTLDSTAYDTPRLYGIAYCS